MGIIDFFRFKKEEVIDKFDPRNNDKRKENRDFKRWEDRDKYWEEIADFIGMDYTNHPDWADDEEKKVMMVPPGAGAIREAEKNGDFPRYLLIRESLRRYWHGRSNWKNNFIKLAVRIHERNEEAITDEKLNVTGGYIPRDSNGNIIKGYRKQEGEVNEKGWLYVPYFRKYWPHEEYDLVRRIGRLKDTWNNTTLAWGKNEAEDKRAGKKWDFDVAACRRFHKYESNYAEELLLQFQLPLYYKDKLTESYVSKSKM